MKTRTATKKKNAKRYRLYRDQDKDGVSFFIFDRGVNPLAQVGDNFNNEFDALKEIERLNEAKNAKDYCK